MSNPKVVLITGCSTGVGLALSALLAHSSSPSYKVYATMRNLAKQDKLVKELGDKYQKNAFIKELDVCNTNSVNTVVADILKSEGRIDVVVNNAGVGLSAPLECISIEQAKENFETNLFGVYRVIQATIPAMKAQNSGQMIQVSSMGGIRGVPFNDVYCSTKFALEGLCESLAPSLKCWNIKLTMIEPGPILTAFVQNAIQNSSGSKEATVDANVDDPFKGKVDEKTVKIFKAYKDAMLSGFKPENAETGVQCAEKIKGVIESENPPFRLQTNANYIPYAKAKLTDITGNDGVEQQFKYFFSNYTQ